MNNETICNAFVNLCNFNDGLFLEVFKNDRDFRKTAVMTMLNYYMDADNLQKDEIENDFCDLSNDFMKLLTKITAMHSARQLFKI